MSLDRQAPYDAGSGKMWYKEVKADSTDLGTPDTWHKFPHVKDSELAFDYSASQPKTETDEGSNSYNIGITASGGKASFKGNFLAVARKKIYDFFVKNRTKYYALVKEVNQTANADGEYEYVFFPCVIIAGGVSMKNGTVAPFEFSPVLQAASVTLSHTGLVASLVGCAATTIGVDIVCGTSEYCGWGVGT
jgi:hypothetical protein